jgi:4-hydroxy 2-oxovalerate aldolase
MNKFNLLDCTLRDGGYITGWKFKREMVIDTIKSLEEARLDLIEVGYLNNKSYIEDTVQFHSIEQIAEFLPTPENRKSIYLAMADVDQFQAEDVTPFTGKSIDGIRVVFYKHQIEKALRLSKVVKDNGYKLFVQPMVTIDYTIEEYSSLCETLAKLDPFAVSIVDSFGYMLKEDFRRYFKVIDDIFPDTTVVGFHSHNNMNLSFTTAQDIYEYQTPKKIMLDASLYGMGRGAGNLQTELACNYYNMVFRTKYNINIIIDLIGKYILPIKETENWGFSPYFFLTGLFHCHPNYATYLLQEHDVSVSEFRRYLKSIPKNMYTTCRKPYVLEKYEEFKNSEAL